MDKKQLKAELEGVKAELEQKEAELTEQAFKAYLNDNYQGWNYGNLEYFAGDLLKNIDPIAFREEYSNWVDAELSELYEQIEELKEELKEWVFLFFIQCYVEVIERFKNIFHYKHIYMLITKH